MGNQLSNARKSLLLRPIRTTGIHGAPLTRSCPELGPSPFPAETSTFAFRYASVCAVIDTAESQAFAEPCGKVRSNKKFCGVFRFDGIFVRFVFQMPIPAICLRRRCTIAPCQGLLVAHSGRTVAGQPGDRRHSGAYDHGRRHRRTLRHSGRGRQATSRCPGR